jgi:hypothetical protein
MPEISDSSDCALGVVILPRDRAALMEALMEADDGHELALACWYRSFARAGHSEVIVVEDTKDSHRGRERSNLGTPLYMAAVLNLALTRAAHR